MAIYGIFSEKKTDDEIGDYTSYGIMVTDGRFTKMIGDISTEEEKIRALAERYNDEELDAAHLEEAIEAFLYDFEV